MTIYTKEDGRLKVTKDAVEYFDIDEMKENILVYQQRIDYIQTLINDLNLKIAEATKLGIKSSAEEVPKEEEIKP